MAATAAKPAKRKRETKHEPAKKRTKAGTSDEDDSSQGDSEDEQSRILLLENKILDSKKHYNNIAALLGLLGDHQKDAQLSVVAAVSLCRVFIRLLATGKLVKRKELTEKELVVVRWLRKRLADYKEALIPMLRREEAALTVLTLAMRILKAEAEHLEEKDEYTFPRAFFAGMVGAIVDASVDDSVRGEFTEKYVLEYDDVRFFTLGALRDMLGTMSHDSMDEHIFSNAFDMLVSVDDVPSKPEELESFFIEPPKQKKHALYSLFQHKKQAQEAWLGLLRLGLTKAQKKRVLGMMAESIAPWFTKPELLMDFLTDCYNAGGSTSLLALSGVFYLIRERNLDYPLFYRKLYSLLDADMLHSKHRARFFRLLDTFLASSHLPAALVASFLKRLVRLALHAPPAAIVAVVPWCYNMFRKHPLTTFMMHRVPRTPEERARLEAGLEDPFRPDEEDPMETRAIDSCIWEVVQLQAHYHPNVATVAKIVSEQFTKEFYNLDDFLDHSYGSLIEAEMAKEVKKAPVVEYMIPKRIFTSAEPGTDDKDSLLVRLWDFGS